VQPASLVASLLRPAVPPVLRCPPLAYVPSRYRGVLSARDAMNRPLKPLVPEDIKHPRASTYFFRAAVATLRARALKCEPEQAARDLFERDAVTPILLRAASSTATISNTTWAGALAATAIEDLVLEISSMSAAAALMQKGLKLDFGAYAQIRAPGRIVDGNDGGSWVA